MGSFPEKYNDPLSASPPLPRMCIISGVWKWRFHCNHSIHFWFLGNEELFKERDQKDDEFLHRLKEFKIDSIDPQSEKVRTPNNEGWLTPSDVLFQSIQGPGNIKTCFMKRWGEKKEGRLPDHRQICRKFIFHMLFNVYYVQCLFSLCAVSCSFSLFLMSSCLTELLMLS